MFLHVRLSRSGGAPFHKGGPHSDDSGARIELEGSASPISQLAKGDKAVLAELVL